MQVTIIGAGNSGLAMAAHLSKEGNRVTLWNRTGAKIAKLIETKEISCSGVINGRIKVDCVTDDIAKATESADVIMVTTPANSHREIAAAIADNIKKEAVIVLNPGRTFGALDFREVYEKNNRKIKQSIAETQTIIYTCRRTGEDSVNIIALKSDILISTFNSAENRNIIARLPICLQQYFTPASSMIETSIGNIGMILHCAPLLLNAGWTESTSSIYKYYYDGITPSIGRFIEKIDQERVSVSTALGQTVETTREWLKRTYHVQGESLYDCIQKNEAYKTIDAPASLQHRYIFEDVPCGLVPLEAVGKSLGLDMKRTSLVIDLACSLNETDYRKIGRNFEILFGKGQNKTFDFLYKKEV